MKTKIPMGMRFNA